jgi:5-methylcytosine-specific restriction endonuclease McrA
MEGLRMRISAPVWDQVFERDNGHCQYCGADLLVSRAAFSSAQVDHVHAVAAGGELEKLENLKLACAICNGSLSRHNHLTTFEARKAVMDEKNKVHEVNFQKWVERLRP